MYNKYITIKSPQKSHQHYKVLLLITFLSAMFLRSQRLCSSFESWISTSQSSISNGMEICAIINEDASIDHHSTTTKSDALAPDKNMPIIKMKRKMRLVGKNNIAPFISSPVHMICRPLPVRARR